MLIRLLILLGFLFVVVRWVSRPLSTLAGAADRFGRNLDEPPLAETGPSEVVRASQAFNRMQVRLRELVREKGRMLTAVSHDLKTPITRLRLRAELMKDADLRTKIGRDLDEMESRVTSTLDLMRGAADAEPLQRTDLVALIESLADDYEDTGRAIEVAAPAVAPVEVRPQALRRAIANLVDNGLKYATNVRIVVRDAPDAVSIDVEDEGPGIPETELERVLEPFYRLEASRNRETGGSGLGLSIARAIAVEHAGSLSLANRSPTGFRATLRLPKR
jgi:signal transduction histidine kinase